MKKNPNTKFDISNWYRFLGLGLCSTGALLSVVGVAASSSICVTLCGGNSNTFAVRSYQGTKRCLDYTPGAVGSPIFLNDCAHAHPIVVEETDAQHDVVLHAGAQVIGGQIPVGLTIKPSSAPSSAPSPTEYALTLQNQPSSGLHATVQSQAIAANQHFALDGDSIILAANRDMVAKVKNSRGAIGTPLVLGARNLADNEFWDFVATDGVDRDPTTGFVRVGYPGDTHCYSGEFFDNNACAQRFSDVIAGNLDKQIPPASLGTVIKLGASLDVSTLYDISIASGVTIRGDRRGTHFYGPEIYKGFGFETLFQVSGSDIRLTQLKMRGPCTSTDGSQANSFGLFINDFDDANQREYVRVLVDHNGVSNFTYAAIRVDDGQDLQECHQDYPNIASDPQRRPTNVHIARNFIHHNEMDELGYGVDVSQGGYPFIEGNTFVTNRHCITGDGRAHSGYKAWSNLVLTYSPQHHTHDFDMHGTGSVAYSAGYGGIGGDYIDIFQNTFMATDRAAFELRGEICNYAEFHNNVSLNDEATDTVLYNTGYTINTGDLPSFMRVSTHPYQFGKPDPMTSMAVGDMDGDRFDDLFLATGASWYYSPGGKGEWRFLSAKADTLDQLLFGDFDGDGRTDVVALHNNQFVVSWGGVSDWEVLNQNPTGGNILLLPGAVTAMAVGDFDGNGISDIFYANGQTWWVSYGGNTLFVQVQTSSFRRTDLRFGDFDGNGTTDVFSVGSTNWQVSYSPKVVHGSFSNWQSLRPKLTDTADGLVVADFNGDGSADVAANCDEGGCWRISYGGFQQWSYVHQVFGIVGTQVAGYGHFTGHASTDYLAWNLNVSNSIYETAGACGEIGIEAQFCISVAGTNPLEHYSTQDMH